MNLQTAGNLAIEPNMAFYAKRQEWSAARRQAWLDEYLTARHEPPALSLGERGLIQDCSKSLEMLFGFRRSDLVWEHVSKLFPQLAGVDLVLAGQVNPMLKYLCRCGHPYHAQNRHGESFSSNLSIVRLENCGKRSLRMIVRPT